MKPPLRSAAIGLFAVSFSTPAHALMLDTAYRGFVTGYGNNGNGYTSDTLMGQANSYEVGFSYGPTRRNYFYFAIPVLAPDQSIVSARLSLYSPDSGLNLSSVNTQTLTFWDVSTSVGSIVDGFGDLGSGTSYGSVSVSRSDPMFGISTYSFNLNGQGISDINAAAGKLFGIGGNLDVYNDGVSRYQVFGGTGGSAVNDGDTVLDLTIVPEPSTWALLSGGACLLLAFGGFRRKWLLHARFSRRTSILVLLATANIPFGLRAEFAANGGVVGWGENSAGALTIPGEVASGVIDVAAGYYHSAALKADGTVVAWGYGEFGQTTVPTNVSGIKAIGAGLYHTVALRTNGTVVAWGAGATPTISDHDYGQSMVPAGLTNVAAISAGGYHTVALKTDGTIVSWGKDIYGAPSGLVGVEAVSAGLDYTVALKTNGTVIAWGYNGYGQTDVPAGLKNVKAVSAGHYQVLALKYDGTIVAWGSGPSVPTGLTNVVAVAAARSHCAALKSDGTVVSWGSDTLTNVPSGLTGVFAISTGGFHTLAIKRIVLEMAPYVEVQPYGTISVDATPQGANPGDYAYQWYFAGAPVPAAFGGTSSSIFLSGIPQAEGRYTVVVTGVGGAVEKGFDFRIRVDSDGDGLSDGQEQFVYGTNPGLADSDRDGIDDFAEINLGSLPNVADTDGDGYNDGYELRTGYDVLSAASHPDLQLSMRTSVEIRFPAAVGSSYTIEHSTDMNAWSTVETNISGTGETIVRHYSTDAGPERFFRVRNQ